MRDKQFHLLLMNILFSNTYYSIGIYLQNLFQSYLSFHTKNPYECILSNQKLNN